MRNTLIHKSDIPKFSENALTAKEFLRKGPGKVLLVEGKNDERFFSRCIEKYDTSKQLKIHTLEGYPNKYKRYDKLEKKGRQFYLGNHGCVYVKEAIIIIIKKRFLDEKNCLEQLQQKFYGIVDKDFDDDNVSIQQYGIEKETKLKDIDIIKERRIISTDSNDIETMSFMFDKKTVENICKNYFSETTYLNDLYFAITCACKLGYIRKENSLHNLGLSFKTVFPEGQPIKYEKYIQNEDINLKQILIDIPRGNKSAIDLLKLPTDFHNKEWIYCRGHDLMGILACYYVLKKSDTDNFGVVHCDKTGPGQRSDVIRRVEDKMCDEIICNTELDEYKDSKVYSFLMYIIMQ